MYLEIFLADFAEMPEFRGSATARNIRSPVFSMNNSLVQSDGNHCYKVTECSAFFVCHATYKAFYKKKIPPIEITT